MSSDLMLDFVNPSMMNKEAGDISIDQDGEWGMIRFLEIFITARAARDKRQLLYSKECLYEATYMYIVIFHLL